VDTTNDPRLIRVPDDEEAWDSLLEVGSKLVANGELLVVPTDTVYGVACDPFNPSAVDRLFAAKQRNRDLPLPVLVHTWRQAIGLVAEVDRRARALIAAYWPGPLTIVFREADGLGWDLGASRGTVAVRMPKQHFTLALICKTGPLAVTSANISGQPTPATVPEIMEQLDEHVGVYFDAGPLHDAAAGTTADAAPTAAGAAPSTIVDLSGPELRVLREGPIPEAEIHRVLEEAPDAQGS